MLGLFQAFKPKFVRHYLQGAQLIQEAIKNYIADIESGNFPSPAESYS
ncbi:3-methyl-2-oxobutanoate hydroxymethyltransferase [Helicobacter bizzozeronii CCUG 35545]|nr:3-methyl-2-oxobutanoate hydroxymethyltransferase [Helicobacter bizzozeronii CCUG 35545]